MTLTYSGNIIRQQDSDRFLLSLFAPAHCRPALWALFAFNYEIAKTREVVSDTTIGLIRLQWWRDAIAEIYERKIPRSHPVIDELSAVIKEHGLLREDFDALIYAREFDLEGVAPANMAGLLHYCDYTTTPLMRLACKIIGAEVEEEVLRQASIEYALIGILRATPHLFHQRRMMLPQDILTHYNMSGQKIFDFNQVKNLPAVTRQILEKKNISYPASLRIKNRFLKAMVAITYLYDRQIKAADFDVLSPTMAHPPKFFALRIWLKSF